MIRDLITVVLVGVLFVIFWPEKLKGPLATAAFILFALAFLWLRPAMSDELRPIPPGNESTSSELVDPTPEEYADIQTWMSSTCCWTNNCCKKVPASALTPLSADEWVVNATQQVRPRTGWSRDGQTWRCTCDYLNGRWVSHPKANTRCIFPAVSGS